MKSLILSVMLMIVGLGAGWQSGQESPAMLTEGERLRVSNLVLRIESTSTSMELLALQHRQLMKRQQELAKELAALGEELLKSRKLDAGKWFVDWATLEIKPRPPAPISAAEEGPKEKRAP